MSLRKKANQNRRQSSTSSESSSSSEPLICCDHGLPCELTSVKNFSSREFGNLGNNANKVDQASDTCGYVNLKELNSISPDKAKKDDIQRIKHRHQTSYDSLLSLAQNEEVIPSSGGVLQTLLSLNLNDKENNSTKGPTCEALLNLNNQSSLMRSLSKRLEQEEAEGEQEEKTIYESSNNTPPKMHQYLPKEHTTNMINLYLGEMSGRSAEQLCVKPASFCLYHRFPSAPITSLDELPSKLPLFIVYKTSHSIYCHYPVHSRIDSDGKEEYSVGIRGEPWFSSLKNLVSSYSTYALFRKRNGSADCFPWWVDSNHKDAINYY